MEALGDPVVSGSAPKWYVARSEEVTYTNSPTEHLISIFLVRETDDGLRVARHEFFSR